MLMIIIFSANVDFLHQRRLSADPEAALDHVPQLPVSAGDQRWERLHQQQQPAVFLPHAELDKVFPLEWSESAAEQQQGDATVR